MSIGILAYGSLLSDRGKKLKPLVVDTIEHVTTPFRVEFARSSSSRDGAPTLIPVNSGGAHVQGAVLVLDSKIDLAQAKTLLWRRETRNECSTDRYARPKNPSPNKVLVDTAKDLQDVDVDTILFTKIGSNIKPLTVDRLATLAICSAQSEAGAKGKDGISYLLSAISNGIVTPLLPGYCDAILRKTGAKDLEEAHRVVRSMAAGVC